MKYVRQFLGRLLGGIGAFMVIAGVSIPFYSHSSSGDIGASVFTLIFGIFLVFCAVLVLKVSIVEGRPAFWFPAISGFVCSCFVLMIAAWLVIKWSAPTTGLSEWTRYMLLFCICGSVLSAVVCVVTGTSAILNLRRRSDERVKDQLG